MLPFDRGHWRYYCDIDLFNFCLILFVVQTITLHVVNSNMETMAKWSKKSLITFNPSETEITKFTCRPFNVYSNIVFDNKTVGLVNNHFVNGFGLQAFELLVLEWAYRYDTIQVF